MSGAPVAYNEINDNITAEAIIKKIGELNITVITATQRAKTNLDNLKARLANSGIDAKEQKEKITVLTNQIRALETSNASLTEKAADLTEINGQIIKLETHINSLLANNEQITDALKTPPTKGGFRYNKKHLEDKRQSRSLHSNSKTTPRKRKKWRRRPGKSVKKGGMKTRRRRRRRNKKSKKSKKRRK